MKRFYLLILCIAIVCITKEVNIAGRMDIRHIPTTLIIDKEGKIQYEEMGYVETRFLPQIKTIIEKLIAG